MLTNEQINILNDIAKTSNALNVLCEKAQEKGIGITVEAQDSYGNEPADAPAHIHIGCRLTDCG